MDGFTITPALEQERPLLENLMHLYLYDFSEFTGDEPDEQGRFTDDYLPRYWQEPGRYPFVIRVAGRPAGFVLVRRISAPGEAPMKHAIAEFFVMRKYRRRGLGRFAARWVFDQFPGRWQVLQMPENRPAQDFWQRVIREYTGGYFRPCEMQYDGGTMAGQEFENG